MTEAINELCSIAMRAENRWTDTIVPRLSMVRAEACSDQIYEPMIHFVLQGSKSLSIGDQVLQFESGTYFVISVDMPALGQIYAKNQASPYLALSLKLDPATIESILVDLNEIPAKTNQPYFSVSTIPNNLMDALLRMTRLLDHSNEVALLAPMIEREILFRVLQGPQGDMLRELALTTSKLSQIRRSIDWIKSHFTEPFHVEFLAKTSDMSMASFYRHFKAITAMTPIQYQKRLRLLKARRMLLFESKDARNIAYAVGYESASQFSREYSRMFGMSPIRDIARFKD